jgi:hypothetical protein
MGVYNHRRKVIQICDKHNKRATIGPMEGPMDLISCDHITSVLFILLTAYLIFKEMNKGR